VPEPKAAVVIPTRNRAEYLDVTLMSVAARQQFEDPYDVVVVDDGSTDDTERVVEPYQASITFVRQGHKGVGAARNTGIRRSRGTYVCYVDADDTLPAERVERQVTFFESLPSSVGMVFTNARVYDDAGSSAMSRLAYTQTPRTDDVYARLLLHNYIFSATAMFRRTALDATGPYDETLVTGEDYDLFLRLTRRFDVAFLDEPLYTCRIHDRSLVHRSPPSEQRETLLRILRKQFDDPALPARLRRLRRRAVGNVHREVARQHLVRGETALAMRELARAAVMDPAALVEPQRLMRFASALLRPTKRRPSPA
jgi:glycosyltransferase involved in cell wall biosynthesis